MRAAAIILLLLLADCTPSYESPVSPTGAEPDFSQAKKLIEANCSGCTGASKEGLVRGIDAMQRVLAVGYVDRKAALRLLGRAYNDLALVYTEPGTAEQAAAAARRRSVLEQLVAFAPNDPDVRYEFAMTIADGDQRIRALREILAAEPRHEDTRFSLAVTLAERKGSEKEAVDLLQDLVQSSRGERAAMYARRFHEVLVRLGRKTEAESLARRFNLSSAAP